MCWIIQIFGLEDIKKKYFIFRTIHFVIRTL